jgi:hypothetical protein
MKYILLLAGIIATVAFAFVVFNQYIYTEKQGSTAGQPGYKDIAYLVEGQAIQLHNGEAETPIANSSSKTVTRIFGNEAEGDLNGDGVSDIAFILTQSAGGSGTFFYAAAALKSDSGYTGTNAVFLGDRIAPQSTEIRDGKLFVNYATRREGEPFTTMPSVGVSTWMRVTGTTLAAEKADDAQGTASDTPVTAPAPEWKLSAPDAQGVQYSYPEDLGLQYVHAQEWPPRVTLEAGDLSCEASAQVQRRNIGGTEYCVTAASEGAAGSVYTTYDYATKQGDFLAHVGFIIRTVQCLNYDEPEHSACAKEQSAFNADALADRIASSIRMGAAASRPVVQ